MPAETMTSQQLDGLRADMDAFYETHRGTTVPLQIATSHFRALGYAFTCPIEETMEAYGLIDRPSHGLLWPHPMREEPWRVDGEFLISCPK